MKHKVCLSTTDHLPWPWEVVEVIQSSRTGPSSLRFDEVNADLREQAVRMKGDAVIGIRYAFLPTGIAAYGTVVRKACE